MTTDRDQSAALSAFDALMMRNAIQMARRGLGTTAPNPSVGTVIADEENEVLIARATTASGGRPHSEVLALKTAGAAARGATLYVTLEPCAHHGVTPPCAKAIISAGVRRVVIGVGDPDPRVSGDGIAMLKEAAVAVATEALGQAARWVTLGHILRVTKGRPFVQMKLAMDADGNVPRASSGRPVWVTGEQARRAGHLLRAETDAVIVGASTVRDDNPDLTCRLPGLAGRSPIRVVLAGSRPVPPEAKIFANAGQVPVWVMALANETVPPGHDKATQIDVAAGPNGVEIKDALGQLAGRGITRVLVEGGPKVWQSFAATGVVDEIQAFVGGDTARKPDAARAAAYIQRITNATPGRFHSLRTYSEDRLYTFRINHDV